MAAKKTEFTLFERLTLLADHLSTQTLTAKSLSIQPIQPGPVKEKATPMPAQANFSILGLLLALIVCLSIWHLIWTFFKMGLPFVHRAGEIQTVFQTMGWSACLCGLPILLAFYNQFQFENRFKALPSEDWPSLLTKVVGNGALVLILWTGLLHLNYSSPVGQPEMFTVSARESKGKAGLTTLLTLKTNDSAEEKNLKLELLPQQLGLSPQDIHRGDQVFVTFEKGRFGIHWISKLQWQPQNPGLKQDKRLLWPQKIDLLAL